MFNVKLSKRIIINNIDCTDSFIPQELVQEFLTIQYGSPDTVLL